MKKLPIIGAIIASFVLSACSLFKTYSTESREVDVYLVDPAINEEKPIEESHIGKISPYFIEGEGYVPYFSIEQYASLYEPYFKSGVKSNVEDEGTTCTWTIYFGEELYFYAVISTFGKTISMGGSIESVLDTGTKNADYEMIKKFAKFEYASSYIRDDNLATYTFNYAGLKTFSKNNHRYYPLGLLDNAFSNASSLYHFYNYKNIYATWNIENYSKEFSSREIDGKTSVDQEMENITDGETIPSYLIDYNNACLFFVLDNFYGLKAHYGISSMKSYFKQYTFYSDFNSTSGTARGSAYSMALSSFDDNHTGFFGANNAWGEGETPTYGGPGCVKRQNQNKKLTEYRKLYFPEDVQYTISDDNKTALYYFDSFELGTTEQVLDENGNVKADAGDYDTYFNMFKHLKLFEEAGVDNVIIDVSTNGGGIVSMMAKLLALISKNNSATIDLLYDDEGVVASTTASVDTNMDGKYDSNESFGNKFNIYIMTSDCSFSCGNAFPCYAQRMGIKVIGETSGGGECAVGEHYLPNSEHIIHSSRIHLGSYNKTEYTYQGFENGATPDISLVHQGKKSFTQYNGNEIVYNIPENLYDVNALSRLLA